jgi:DNA-binding response OmpR family regulator
MRYLTGRRILIMEEEGLVAMLADGVVVEAGGETVIAGTVAEALAILDRLTPDAAILGTDPAGKHGLVVVKRLQSMRVPFVICTGHDQASVDEAFRSAPILAKPYSARDLRLALAGLFAGRDNA